MHASGEERSPCGRSSVMMRDGATAAAYRFGWAAGLDPRYAGQIFEEVEATLRREWAAAGDLGEWDRHRDLVREGFACAREAHADAPPDEEPVAGVEPLHADPATEVANRVHDRVAHRKGIES